MFKYNHGFTLLEILVALLIVSIGLLGVATLQMRGQQINYVSYYRSQATFLAEDLMERMQVNFREAALGNYQKDNGCDTVIAPSIICEGDTTNCDDNTLMTYDIDNWCYNLQKTLPKAEAIINFTLSTSASTVPSTYTIRICWANILDTDSTGCDKENLEEQTWFHIAPPI